MANDTDQKMKTAPLTPPNVSPQQQDARLKPQNNPPSQADVKNLYLEIRALISGEGDSVYDVPRKWCYGDGNVCKCTSQVS